MNTILEQYLNDIEVISNGREYDHCYLWRRTPTSSIGMQQLRIIPQTGVSDWQVDHPGSRPFKVIDHLWTLHQEGELSENFTVLDICCGDALILAQIKRIFPNAHCYGFDCNKDVFETHNWIQALGVKLYFGYIQELFDHEPDVKFDVAMMMNTYVGWEWADLKPEFANLPEKANKWLGSCSRYGVVTAREHQIDELFKQGFDIKYIGEGESGSTMVCFNKNGGQNANQDGERRVSEQSERTGSEQ